MDYYWEWKEAPFVVQIIGYGENVANAGWWTAITSASPCICDENGEGSKVHPGSYPEDWQLLITDVLENLCVAVRPFATDAHSCNGCRQRQGRWGNG